jgi:hypothetical protein
MAVARLWKRASKPQGAHRSKTERFLEPCRPPSLAHRFSGGRPAEGGSLNFHFPPGRGFLSRDERKTRGELVEVEMVLKVARAEPGIVFLSLPEPGTGKTHDQSATHAQDPCGPGRTDPALIFSQGIIQAVVQGGLNGPIAAPGVEQPLGIQALFVGAADQIAGFLGLAPAAPHPGTQPPDLPGGGETHLLRAHAEALQGPHLPPGPIMIPAQGLRPLLGLRGKKTAIAAFSPGCHKGFLDSY